MSQDTQENRTKKSPYAAGSVLGVGVGAAIGYAIGDLGNGIWIGAVIGVGLALLADYIRK